MSILAKTGGRFPLIAILLAWLPLHAQGNPNGSRKEPEILSLFPLGGQRGTTLEVRMRGKNLGGTYAVWLDGGELKARVQRVDEIELMEYDLVKKAWKSQPGYRVSFQVEIDASADIGTHSIRAVTPQGVSNALPFRVTFHPVLTETGDPHQTPGEAQKLRFPVVVNGKISRGGELDFFGFDAAEGQELTFEVVSHLGIEPTLTLYEPAGSWFDPNRVRELAFHLGRLATPATIHTFDRMPNYERPRLTYRFSRKGHYLVQVGANMSKGGPDCPYQFRISPADPSVTRPLEHRSVQGLPSGWAEFSRKLEPDRLERLWSRTVRETADSSTPAAGLSRLMEAEPNQSAGQAQEAAVGSIVEGSIDRPGDIDHYRFKVRDGAKLAFEIETPDVTPPFFNPRLTVLDAEGNETFNNIYRRLGRQFQFYSKTVEAKTLHSFESGGEFTLQVRDITSRQGDPSFVYRLLIRPQIPHMGDIEVKDDRVNLRAGTAGKLTVITDQEEGFGGEIVLSINNLPAGVEALPGTELEPEKGINPDEGPKERFVPKSQKATVLLVAREDAPATPMPRMIRIVARPVVGGSLGPSQLVREVPLMVVKRARQVLAGTREEEAP